MREFSIGNIRQSSFPTFFDVNVGYLQKAKALVIEFSTIISLTVCLGCSTWRKWLDLDEPLDELIREWMSIKRNITLGTRTSTIPLTRELLPTPRELRIKALFVA